MSSRSRCAEAAAVAAVVTALLSGCALTAESEPERVVVSSESTPGAPPEGSSVPLSIQVYLVHGDRLERVTRLVPAGKGLEPVLQALSAPVDPAELAAGLRTAVPAGSRPLAGRMSDPRTADVTVPTGYDRLSMGQQELAVAQVVFTLTADTLADRVRLVSGSGAVAVPVARGGLVTRPVFRQDYAAFAPGR